ncbi:unnamed protein product [Haemonchus placei]|uniref:Secreted protein n=1 Tax=Haemonchus placei TaxID=6290 RepID=A0A0N4W9D3_HAEPC|nr:unnamed protein product [Haemonchus placei]
MNNAGANDVALVCLLYLLTNGPAGFLNLGYLDVRKSGVLIDIGGGPDAECDDVSMVSATHADNVPTVVP